jgi:hypothetical protein
MYTLALGLVALPLVLTPCIVGLTYLAAARRIARGQRTGAYIALVMASLHGGAFLIWTLGATYETLRNAWMFAHPPRAGWVPDSPPNWLLWGVGSALALSFVVLLGAVIFHIARFLRSASSTDCSGGFVARADSRAPERTPRERHPVG